MVGLNLPHLKIPPAGEGVVFIVAALVLGLVAFVVRRRAPRAKDDRTLCPWQRSDERTRLSALMLVLAEVAFLAYSVLGLLGVRAF